MILPKLQCHEMVNGKKRIWGDFMCKVSWMKWMAQNKTLKLNLTKTNNNAIPCGSSIDLCPKTNWFKSLCKLNRCNYTVLSFFSTTCWPYRFGCCEWLNEGKKEDIIPWWIKKNLDVIIESCACKHYSVVTMGPDNIIFATSFNNPSKIISSTLWMTTIFAF